MCTYTVPYMKKVFGIFEHRLRSFWSRPDSLIPYKCTYLYGIIDFGPDRNIFQCQLTVELHV